MSTDINFNDHYGYHRTFLDRGRVRLIGLYVSIGLKNSRELGGASLHRAWTDDVSMGAIFVSTQDQEHYRAAVRGTTKLLRGASLIFVAKEEQRYPSDGDLCFQQDLLCAAVYGTTSSFFSFPPVHHKEVCTR